MPDLPSVDLTRHRIDIFAATAAPDHPAPRNPRPPGLTEAIVRALAEAAPTTWSQLNGEFSIAGDEEAMQAVALTDQHSHSIPIDAEVADMVRLHRRTSIGTQGPWLRWMFTCDREGNLKVGFDHGAIELPPAYLLSPQAYRQDIERYPRAADIPLWLLAYMGDDGRQLRSAGQARSAERLTFGEDRVADHEIPHCHCYGRASRCSPRWAVVPMLPSPQSSTRRSSGTWATLAVVCWRGCPVAAAYSPVDAPTPGC